MSLPNSSWHRLAIRGPWVPGQAVNFRAAANLLYSIDKDLGENDVVLRIPQLMIDTLESVHSDLNLCMTIVSV